jgi:L-rhamnose mutarotase
MSSSISRSTSNNQKFKQQLNNDLKQQQYIAQIAKLSCEVTRFVITKGISNYKIYLKRTPKSKYEYNHERVRNFTTQRQSKYYYHYPIHHNFIFIHYLSLHYASI